MPHVLEAATSGRSRCRGCGERIASGEQRFGERLPNPYSDDGGEMTHWFHLPCAAFRRPASFLEVAVDPAVAIEDRDRLQHEARLGVAHRRLPRASAAGRAPTGRAKCRSCRELIEKDAWRVALVFDEEGRFVPSGFIHASCVPAYFETAEVMARLRHFSPDLGPADLAEIQAILDETPGPAPGRTPTGGYTPLDE